MDIFRKQNALDPYFAQSYGCAAFASVTKAGVGIGGAHGAGDVYKLPASASSWPDDATEEHVARVDLIQAELGVTLGYEQFAEIVFLETKADFDKFMSGKGEFLADAEAAYVSLATAHDTALKGKDISKPEYKKGMKVFTAPTKGKAGGGLFVNAAVGGQKFHVKK